MSFGALGNRFGMGFPFLGLCLDLLCPGFPLGFGFRHGFVGEAEGHLHLPVQLFVKAFEGEFDVRHGGHQSFDFGRFSFDL